MRPAKKSRLSQREFEITYLAAKGLTDKQIAENLGSAEGSIKTHWQRLRQKMNLSSRASVVARILAEDHAALIEELRLSELRMSLAVEAIDNLAFFMMDPQGTLLSWNQGVLHVLGFSEEEFVGQTFDILFSAGDIALGMPEDELDHARKDGRHYEEQWHVKKSGERLFASGSLFAIRDKNGEIEFFLKIMQNRTREKQLEIELEQLRLRFDEFTKGQG